jgi:hypothetical protein
MHFHDIAHNAEQHRPRSPRLRTGGISTAGLVNPFDQVVGAIAKPGRDVIFDFGGIDTTGYTRLAAFVMPHGEAVTVRLEQLGADGEVLAAAKACKPEISSIASAVLDLAPLHEGLLNCRVVVRDGPADFRLGLFRASPLMQLADHFGSDKGSIRAWSLEYGAHGYAEIYDSVFTPWCADSFALLEIGLHTPSTHGGMPTDAPSLRLWGEYFPRARFYGFDINDFRHVSLPRARILRGDQGSPVDIAALQCLLADDPPRIIIDDGSHRSPHQQGNFATLFSYLEPGGLYVIEDLCWQPFQEGPKTIDVLREWGRTGRLRSPFICEKRAAVITEAVESICLATPHRCAMAILTRKR